MGCWRLWGRPHELPWRILKLHEDIIVNGVSDQDLFPWRRELLLFKLYVPVPSLALVATFGWCAYREHFSVACRAFQREMSLSSYLATFSSSSSSSSSSQRYFIRDQFPIHYQTMRRLTALYVVTGILKLLLIAIRNERRISHVFAICYTKSLPGETTWLAGLTLSRLVAVVVRTL